MATLQHVLWDREHDNPSMFPFVASDIPNPGVVQFWEWLESKHAPRQVGLEICCGKGRNAIWLAGKGVRMSAFDFSVAAVVEANRRQERLSLPKRIDCRVQDAMISWPYEEHSFDFVVDCFGTSDIESANGRKNVLDETLRVLKRGGYYFLQIDTPELGFFADRYRSAPGPDANTLIFPNGKVEAFLTEADLEKWNHPLNPVEIRREIETTLEICGQTEPYKYFWIVMRAPI